MNAVPKLAVAAFPAPPPCTGGYKIATDPIGIEGCDAGTLMTQDECLAFKTWLEASADNMVSMGFTSNGVPKWYYHNGHSNLGYGCQAYQAGANIYVYFENDSSNPLSSNSGAVYKAVCSDPRCAPPLAPPPPRC